MTPIRRWSIAFLLAVVTSLLSGCCCGCWDRHCYGSGYGYGYGSGYAQPAGCCQPAPACCPPPNPCATAGFPPQGNWGPPGGVCRP
jgi:hypothetical protein